MARDVGGESFSASRIVRQPVGGGRPTKQRSRCSEDEVAIEGRVRPNDTIQTITSYHPDTRTVGFEGKDKDNVSVSEPKMSAESIQV